MDNARNMLSFSFSRADMPGLFAAFSTPGEGAGQRWPCASRCACRCWGEDQAPQQLPRAPSRGSPLMRNSPGGSAEPNLNLLSFTKACPRMKPAFWGVFALETAPALLQTYSSDCKICSITVLYLPSTRTDNAS